MCKASVFVCACVAFASASGVNDRAQPACVAIEKLSRPAGFDPVLIAALAWHESRFDPEVVSPSGALGIMQVRPRWVTGDYGPFTVDELSTVEGSVRAGLLSARRWVEFVRSTGKKADWLACYNAGIKCKAEGFVKAVRGYEVRLRKYLARERRSRRK